MSDFEYCSFVASRWKSPDATRSPSETSIHHAILGLMGELGELVDAIKKSWIYETELDRENVIEELGDIEFYLEAFRQAFGISREDVLMKNVQKLKTRYPQGYSNEDALRRRDKEQDQ